MLQEWALEFRRLEQWQAFDRTGRRKYLSAAERERFLAAAPFAPSAIGALLQVLAYTGCRVSEALSLTIHQLDTEAGTLTFRTLKRRRLTFRNVPIPEELAGLLRTLSIDEAGRFWPMHRVTAWRHVKATMEAIDVRGPMACCRGLRHGFGMHAAGRYVPPNLIQRWMGHASLSTTAIYLDATGAEERNFAARTW